MENLLKWAGENGVTDSLTDYLQYPKNEIIKNESCIGKTLFVSNFFNGGRGLGAIRSIKRGESILLVPKKLLMSVESAHTEDPNLSSLLSRYSNLHSHQTLVIHLLNELFKGPSSRWSIYLSQLPRHYTNFLNFSEDECQALQIPDAISHALNVVDVAKSDWLLSKPILKNLNLPKKYRSFSAWCWASSSVLSRTVFVPWNETGALCPIGDLFNHISPGSHNEDESTERKNHLVDDVYGDDGDVQNLHKRKNDDNMHINNNHVNPTQTNDGSGNGNCNDGDNDDDKLSDVCEERVNHNEKEKHEEERGGKEDSVKLDENDKNEIYKNDIQIICNIDRMKNEKFQDTVTSNNDADYTNDCDDHKVNDNNYYCNEDVDNDDDNDKNNDEVDDYDDDGFDIEITDRLLDGEFIESLNCYVFYSNQNYKEGDQVFIRYGKYRNLELLEIYGFVQNNNKNDEIDINLQNLKKLNLPNVNLSKLDEILTTMQGRKYLREDGKCSFCLLAALRLLALPPHHRRASLRFVLSGKCLSVENELLAYTCLLHELFRLIQNLPTSIADDIRMLSNSSGNENFLKNLDIFGTLYEQNFGSESIEIPGHRSSNLDLILNEFIILHNKTLKDLRSIFEDLETKKFLTESKFNFSEKMKLAIRWRILFKKILIFSINYCCLQISRLRNK